MTCGLLFFYMPCIPILPDKKKRKLSSTCSTSNSAFDCVDYGFFDDYYDDMDETCPGKSLDAVGISYKSSFSPAEIMISSLNSPRAKLRMSIEEECEKNFDAKSHQEKWFNRKISEPEKYCPECKRGKTLFMEMYNPCVYIRSFSNPPKEIAIAVSAFRVVSRPFLPNTVEFRFSVCSIHQSLSAWRTHDDFVALARENSVYHRADMKRTRAKFDSLLHHRRSIKVYDPCRLIEQVHRLSEFLEDFFFTIDDEYPEILLEFANNSTWIGSWGRPQKSICSACDLSISAN